MYSILSLVQKESKKKKEKLYSNTKFIAKVNSDGNVTYQIVEFLGDNKHKLKNINTQNIENFSGIIKYFRIDGEITKVEAYSGGVFMQEFKEISHYENVKAKSAPPVNGDPGVWIPILIEKWTDWYQNFNGGPTVYYSKSTNYSSSIEYVWVSTGGGTGYSTGDTYHSHFNSPHGPSPTDPVDNHPDEILIDPSFASIEKIDCTYNQLMKNTTIQELLKDFFGSDADYDLIFKVENNLVCNNNSDVAGCTNSNYDPNDKKVVISIDEAYINDNQTPTLFLARTILHEAIHANLFLAVKKLNGGITPSNSDFGVLYEEYRQEKGWQHEIIADKYRNLIVQGLQDVHSLLGDQNFINDRTNNFPDWNWGAFYNELSWIGLYDTTKGQEHVQSSGYETNVSLYLNGAKVNSTKTPNCD